MFGFINVYKPKGKTSHDVVAILRKITKIKQIGHTGTLDPFAEGVLPICIGKATRLIEYLKDDKAYIGTIQLGQATTTYDIEGEITKQSDKTPSIEEIKTILGNFRGEIKQLPPIYSAIKVNGKKLYEYAREGKNIEIEPRIVNIDKLDIVNYNSTTRVLEIQVVCSKGTYIRSIANDIGEQLGVYGHLTKLIRIKAGDFKIDSSIKLDELTKKEDVELNLIPPLNYLNYPRYQLNDKEKELVTHGMPIQHNDLNINGTILLTYNNEIASIGTIENNTIKSKKVFL